MFEATYICIPNEKANVIPQFTYMYLYTGSVIKDVMSFSYSPD